MVGQLDDSDTDSVNVADTGSNPVLTTNAVQIRSLTEVLVRNLWRYELHREVG